MSEHIIDDVGELFVLVIIMFVGFTSLAHYIIFANSTMYDDTGYDKVKMTNYHDSSKPLETLDNITVEGPEAAYMFYIMSNIYNEKLKELKFRGWAPNGDEVSGTFNPRPGEWKSYKINTLYTSYILDHLHTINGSNVIKYSLELSKGPYGGENSWELYEMTP